MMTTETDASMLPTGWAKVLRRRNYDVGQIENLVAKPRAGTSRRSS